jgi:hypothetical protein
MVTFYLFSINQFFLSILRICHSPDNLDSPGNPDNPDNPEGPEGPEGWAVTYQDIQLWDLPPMRLV